MIPGNRCVFSEAIYFYSVTCSLVKRERGVVVVPPVSPFLSRPIPVDPRKLGFLIGLSLALFLFGAKLRELATILEWADFFFSPVRFAVISVFLLIVTPVRRKNFSPILLL